MNDKVSKLRALVEEMRTRGAEYLATRLRTILDSPEPDAEPAEIDYLREQLLQRTNELESLRAENARLAAELAKAREDAERWQWAERHQYDLEIMLEKEIDIRCGVDAARGQT